jgi:nitrogen fixation NifU-like protein
MSFLRNNGNEVQALVEDTLGKYSKKVIEHWLSPRNFKPLELPDGHGRITGPCGDTMEIYLRFKDGEVAEASFTTDGCLTSIVSASATVELATGKSISQVRSISQEQILDALDGLPEDGAHCALLAAKTLRVAVDDYLRAVDEAWLRGRRER